MASNPKVLKRFFSEQGRQNYAYISEENETNMTMLSLLKQYHRIPFEHDQQSKKNFLSQFKLQAEHKIDNFGKEAGHDSGLFETSTVSDVISIPEDSKNNIISVSSIPSHTIVETNENSHREMKSGSQRFRWNLLFNVLVWSIVPLPFWIPFVSNRLAYLLLPCIQGVFVFMWLIIAILALKNSLILYLNRSHDFTKEYVGYEKIPIRHIVTISCYKEPVDLIARSVQTVADQTEVHRITMVISFEQRTPDKEKKCQFLQEKFQNCGFEKIIFTIHPFGLPNEIPGKCSNSNYGLRMAVKEMNITDDEMDNILVTTCDADSKFSPQYIAALTSKYLKENRPALTTIYQAPLFYNWKLDSLSFVTRVTGLLRSLLMLGALIPFNINTMSIFSFSLRLAKEGDFVHPAYQMDDIICLIRWMGVTQKRLRISMIPVPVVSGPTLGETIETEIIEWTRQARRWTIGAAEVFHYFIIKSRRMPAIAACSWGIVFLIYYGVLLCTSGLFGLTATLSIALLIKDVPVVISNIMYGLLGLQMLTFSVAFFIDAFIAKLLNVNECICLIRNLFHFITTPFVLLGYSFVEFYALHEVVIFGKKVCKHGASKKLAL
ncbi:unnamed protein product [Rotaria sordida]|uniref:Glycosyltransferase 2-like domain-containing protein n=1 Tax=Rotaria sordida TaxID=392033 RepID=A0A814SXC4_9BILA|nr:unnamed protein product [Rotaria sordida]CAF3839612.1 unnamed protein product [Rotaria sordida]